MAKILIIEDEKELANILRSYLERANYEVLSAYRGDTGLNEWETKHPDLVLLDLNLPGMDGLDVARAIRRKDETPIIMVTARVEEIDKLIGLELGADDYISKPFSPREVVARVKTVLRRSTKSSEKTTFIQIRELIIDFDAHMVSVKGEHIDLTPTEFSILATLAEHPGRVFSRLQLLEASQGNAYEGYERSIDAHIKNLRAKLEDDPKNPHFIETVFGIGYKLSRD